MDLDKLLDARQTELMRDARLERLGPACLPFAELGAPTLSDHTATTWPHVRGVPRCASDCSPVRT